MEIFIRGLQNQRNKMVTRIGGSRRKTRYKLKKTNRQKGKISLSKYFQSFKEGEKVLLHAEPAIQAGMYHPRYHGKVGIVVGKQGRCYKVDLKDHNKKKQMLVHPVHMRKVQ